jgi:hypothetical protein
LIEAAIAPFARDGGPSAEKARRYLFVRGAWFRVMPVMSGKKPRRETPPDRSAAKAAIPLCRYEELAMRENRLRQAKAAKCEPGD